MARCYFRVYTRVELESGLYSKVVMSPVAFGPKVTVRPASPSIVYFLAVLASGDNVTVRLSDPPAKTAWSLPPSVVLTVTTMPPDTYSPAGLEPAAAAAGCASPVFL